MRAARSGWSSSPLSATTWSEPARPAREDAALIPAHGDRRRSRIGLLGGSYNPAHAGHRHVAELARRKLRLDQVWLLVSPGNPLKPRAGMAPRAERLALARAIADGRRIVATDIEATLGTRFTVDTLRALRRRFPEARFVWLMGADNLEQLPRWRRWRDIVRCVPFAVLPRPTYNHRALAGQAARCLRAARRPARLAPALAGMAPPAWMFLPAPQHAASASAIRAALSGV
jgi:nicotinate-nucleotide adenylyltransferase